VLVAVAPVRAWAAGPTVCTDAYESAQVLRKQGKLVAASEQLHACAQQTCPALVVTDCVRWLDEVTQSLPSVVPLATDEAGDNLVDVNVSVDGAPLVATSAGRAIELDPGPHRFRFERGASSAETTVLVAVGEKNKRVAVVLRLAAPSQAADPKSTGRPGSTLGRVGLIAGAAGVVALGTGAVFGVEALRNQSAAHCPANVCRPGSNPGALRTAQTDGDVSTVLFVAGGALAAAGVMAWLLAPSHARASSASWTATPVALASGAGFVLLGGF
jgi:hypothetical protein